MTWEWKTKRLVSGMLYLRCLFDIPVEMSKQICAIAGEVEDWVTVQAEINVWYLPG